MIQCSKCGTLNNDEFNFCSNCGKKIDIVECPNCHKLIDLESTCINCGYSLISQLETNLNEFKKLNNTFDDIFNCELLIILKDGTNLTSYDDIQNKDEVIFISEDLSLQENLSSKYEFYKSLKLIIAKNLTANVKRTDYMFGDCKSLESLLLINWDVSNVTNMQGMFFCCESLKDIDDLNNWDVSNVTKMRSMFKCCYNLSNIDCLENWNTINVTDMSWMFESCTSLNNIKVLNKWKVNSNLNSNSMFFGSGLSKKSFPKWIK